MNLSYGTPSPYPLNTHTHTQTFSKQTIDFFVYGHQIELDVCLQYVTTLKTVHKFCKIFHDHKQRKQLFSYMHQPQF